MASKERSLRILGRYFTDTPDAQIAKDMEEFCPELVVEPSSIKTWFRREKVRIYVAMFIVGCIILFASSAGWGAGFLGWHVVLAGIFVAPLIYDLGKVGV